jgi:hypothetical protein
MKTAITLALGLLLGAATVSPARTVGRIDCRQFTAKLVTLESAVSRQMSMMAGAAAYMATGDLGLLDRMAENLQNPVALMSANAGATGKLLEAAAATIAARKDVLAEVGCAAKQGG